MILKNVIKLKKIPIWIGASLLIVIFIAFFFFSIFFKTYKELGNLKSRQALLEKELFDLEKEFIGKESYYKKLLEDNEFYEKIARQRLGYAKKNELLFRFPGE